MKDSVGELMEVGVVAGTHGVRGDLKIRPLPTGELALTAAQKVLMRDRSGQLTLHTVQHSTSHKQFVLLRLEGLTHIDEARSLVGQTILVDRGELSGSGDGHYYWCDLEGLTVIDQRRGAVGRIEEMFATPAHDILVVRSPDGEVLFPAIPPFIIRVDPEAGEMLVDLPDGLVPFIDEV
jgi:16S rRNA processing protein RimM